MKKLIFLTLIVSLALVFISCEGDTNTQPEATIGNEETVAETVTTTEVTSAEETVAETVTTTEVTSGEETLAETVTTAEVTSDEETVAETVTTTEVTSGEETLAETVTTAEVTSNEETVAETVTTEEATSDEETVAETVTTEEATSDEETVAETVTTAEVTSAEETVEETVTTAEVTSDEETVTETVTTEESMPEETTEANQCTVPFNTVLFQTPQESSSKFNISKASSDFSEQIYLDKIVEPTIKADILGKEYTLTYVETVQLPRSDMIVNTYQYLGDEDDFKILINAATGEIVEYIGVSYEHNCISEEDYLDCIKSLLPEKYSLDLYNSYKVYTHYYSFGENYMVSKEIEGFKMCGENEQLGGHTFVFTQKIGNVSLANHVSVEFSHGSISIELYDFGYDLDEASVFIESFEKVESQFKTYITSKAKEDYTVSNIENKSYQFFMKGGIPYIMITSEIEMYRGEDKSQTFSALLKTFTTFDIES